MWYVILYVVIAAFVAAILKVAFNLDSDDESELVVLVFGGICWPVTIAAGIFYLLVRLFIIIIKLIEKGIRYLISKINISDVKLL